MKLSRRGLLGWLGALTSAAAVSRVAPAEAEAPTLEAMADDVRRNAQLPSHQGPLTVTAVDHEAKRVAFEQLRVGTSRYGSIDERCPLHGHIGCDLGAGHAPYDYIGTDGVRRHCNGLMGGWKMRPAPEPLRTPEDTINALRASVERTLDDAVIRAARGHRYGRWRS